MTEWNMLFQRLEDSKLVDLRLIVCWLIWTNKNHCFYSSSCKRPSGIVRIANQIKDDFISASISLEPIQTVSDSIWKAPNIGIMKLNVDVAYYPTSREASLRMVVRDHMGEVYICAATRVENIESPLQAELKAILFGIKEVISIQHPFLIVESDSLIVV